MTSNVEIDQTLPPDEVELCYVSDNVIHTFYSEPPE